MTVAKFTLWESKVNTLTVGHSFNVLVREFNSSKYLSTAFEKTEIKQIDDIGEISPDDSDSVEAKFGLSQTFSQIKVIGVLDKYSKMPKLFIKSSC